MSVGSPLAFNEVQGDPRAPRPRWFVPGVVGAMVLAGIIEAAYLASIWNKSFTKALVPLIKANGDAQYYNGQAQLNTQGHWFVQWLWYVHTALQGHPEYLPSASHPPVATLFFTMADYLGLRTWMEHSVVLAVLFVLTVGICGLIGERAVSARAGVICAVVVASYPYLWVNPGSNLSETAVLFFVALVLWALLRFRARPKLTTALEVGLYAAAAALSRSELTSLTVLVVAPTMLMATRLTWRQRIAAVTVTGVAFLALSAPWLIRNQDTFKRSVWYSDQIGVTLLDANCPQTYSGYYAGWWWGACGLRADIPAGLDESQVDHIREQVAIHYIEAHKVRAAEIVALRVLRAWNFYDPNAQVLFDYQDARPHWVSYLALAEYYEILALSVVGVVGLVRRKLLVWPYLGLIAGATFAVASTFSNGRYRVEGDLAMALLAGYGIEWLVQRARREHGVSLTDSWLRAPSAPSSLTTAGAPSEPVAH